MEYFRKISKGAQLVSGMAERLDVSVADCAGSAPELQSRNFASMVMRCAGCSQQDQCTRLQAANETLAEAPDYCRNKDLFDRFKPTDH